MTTSLFVLGEQWQPERIITALTISPLGCIAAHKH